MKTPLLVLLALSLAGNAVLALFVWQRPASTGNVTAPQAATTGSVRDEKPAVAAVSSSPAADSGGATSSFQWPSLQRKEDLPGLVARLRAAGFPPATIRAILQQTITTMFADRANSLTGPYWKPYNPNPEAVAAQQALNKERQALVESLLGPDGRPSAAMDPAGRERRYGQLSSDKIDSIEAVNRDYANLQSQAFSQRRPNSPQDGQAMAKQLEFLREEQRKDIAAILTPAELEQYEMRSSPSASRVMGNLRSVDVTETEYAALYRLQKSFDDANPQVNGRISSDDMAKRDAAQIQMQETARSILPDDRYYEYLKAADYRYAQAANFTAQYPSVTPATTYELYQLDRATQAAVSQLPSTLTREQRQAELDKLGATYNARTQQLLGAEAAAKYGIQSVGRIFQQSTSSGVQPAIKFGGG